MQIKAYSVVGRAVEEGLNYGIGRLFKHNDEPMTEERMREQVETLHNAVMGELCEVVEFSDEDLGLGAEDE